jgi:DNA-binding FadR family transcriptional regulator
MEDSEQANRQVRDASSFDAFTPIETKNINQIIIERLVELMRTGEITPGQKIPSEKELMRKFDVGRSSVREALHSLVAMGFLESRPGKGYFVTQVAGEVSREHLVRLATNKQAYCHIMEARHELDITIARLAVERATPSDLAKLESTHERIVEAADRGEDIRPLTSLFHLAVAEMTHNPVFVQLLGALIPSWKAAATHKRIPDDEHLKLHRLLLESLRKRDVEQMIQLMDEYHAIARKFYVDGDWEAGGEAEDATSDT